VLIDFHIHSSYDPAIVLSPADILKKAQEAGLDGICLTNIHSVSVESEFLQLAKLSDFVVLVGFEAVTDHGHFLVFDPEPQSLPMISNWLRFDTKGRVQFDSLHSAVCARGGIIIAAHPYDRTVPDFPGDRVLQLPDIAAIETLNGRRDLLANDLAEEAAASLGLPAVGGSDARTQVNEIGRVATLVRGRVCSEAELIECVRGGDVWPVTLGELAVPTQTGRHQRGEERHSRDHHERRRPDRRPASRPKGPKPE
jgi:predicted metal-dependent phosphoesterase TrpH